MLKYIRRLNYAITAEESRADLNTLLSALNPTNSFEDRIDSLKSIMEWIRLPVSTNNGETLLTSHQARNIRYKFLLQFLERHPEPASFFFSTFQEMITRGSAVRFYYLTGIQENSGFFNELTDRIVQNLLPPTHREKDLAEIVKVVFTDEEDPAWFESSPEEIITPFLKLLEEHHVSIQGLIDDRQDALVILGAQIAALGISREIRRHLDAKQMIENNFIKLAMAINRDEPNNEILGLVSLARHDLNKVRLGLEETGVSVDLIYKLEKIQTLLTRVEMILSLSKGPYSSIRREVVIARCMGQLIRDELKGLGVRDYIMQNIHLLTRKIVERAGDKGDTYIAYTRGGQKHLFEAASWAGVLTAFTAVVKYWIGIGEFPLFIEGFFYFVNYAIGFLLMQKWHLALSSKQPAYMASALSNNFEKFMETKKLSDVIFVVKKVFSSQFIAALANLLWVVPVTFVLDRLFYFIKGEHIVGILEAPNIIEKHSLYESLTLTYAFLTGILLWMSSVVAGWTENWIVFRNVHLLIKESSFLKKFLGKEKTHKIAENFPSVMAGVAGNLSIAFFLASPIIIGKLLGLPLDIRHVTLAAGTVTLALSAMEWSLSEWPTYLHMFLSITVIGILNFGISFYCAIKMAALARNVDSRYLKVIFKYALVRRKNKTEEEPQD